MVSQCLAATNAQLRVMLACLRDQIVGLHSFQLLAQQSKIEGNHRLIAQQYQSQELGTALQAQMEVFARRIM